MTPLGLTVRTSRAPSKATLVAFTFGGAGGAALLALWPSSARLRALHAATTAARADHGDPRGDDRGAERAEHEQTVPPACSGARTAAANGDAHARSVGDEAVPHKPNLVSA